MIPNNIYVSPKFPIQNPNTKYTPYNTITGTHPQIPIVCPNILSTDSHIHYMHPCITNTCSQYSVQAKIPNYTKISFTKIYILYYILCIIYIYELYQNTKLMLPNTKYKKNSVRFITQNDFLVIITLSTNKRLSVVWKYIYLVHPISKECANVYGYLQLKLCRNVLAQCKYVSIKIALNACRYQVFITHNLTIYQIRRR